MDGADCFMTKTLRNWPCRLEGQLVPPTAGSRLEDCNWEGPPLISNKGN